MIVAASHTPRIRAFAPGRTELAGNHTDHQGGRVIAASVDCGVHVEAWATGLNRVRMDGKGFGGVDFTLDDVSVQEAERGTTTALVRGVVRGLRDAGTDVGGFDARVKSTVPAGGGLSSSAAFELALTAALEGLFGNGRDPLALAKIGQFAESAYFGKPCGLMDQAAIACGGINVFDFFDELPATERIDFDFAQSGYALCLIDVHCDHSAYTEEYAQVANDMFAVARLLGAKRLADLREDHFVGEFDRVRDRLGDRALLRALHYYYEMRLVDIRARALRLGDIDEFLHATRQSGASSAQYLQNVSCAGRDDQPAMVALALADMLLMGEGAARIHGGGFGGTVQAFVPEDRVRSFVRAIDARLGAGSCQVYTVTAQGAQATFE